MVVQPTIRLAVQGASCTGMVDSLHFSRLVSFLSELFLGASWLAKF